MDGPSLHAPGKRAPGLLPCLLVFLLVFLAGCSAGQGQAKKSLPGVTPSSTNQPIAIVAQPTPTSVTLSPTVTAAPIIPQPSGILPPGSSQPSEAACAARVHRSSFEPRPENAQANARVPTAQQLAGLTPWGSALGQSSQADTLRKQITGNFTGTTDEILQWVACKWGIDPDIVRAEAVVESYWKQGTQGDYTTDQSLCPPGTWNGQGCYQSYGILQIKYTYFQSTWPMSRDDTAFSAEYVYGMIRSCYEGWTTYLYDRTPSPGYPSYHAGDLWGCIGRWFSGSWYDQGALNYIAQVKAALANKTWLKAGF